MGHDEKSGNEYTSLPNEQGWMASGGELERRLQRAMDAGRIFSWETDPASGELTWSGNMEAVVGFPLIEDVEKTARLVHPDDLGRLRDAVVEATESGGEFGCEFRLVNPATGE